jgi:hypothetical protein
VHFWLLVFPFCDLDEMKVHVAIFYFVSATMRTKQYMANTNYNAQLLFYPKSVADVRLPSGLPQGQPASCY